jgi:hypothetical protein
MTTSAPDRRVQRLRSLGYRDGPVQRAVARALAAGGGRIDTGEATAAAYPDALRWSKGEYRNVRRALQRIAVPVGRSADRPGRPIIWQSRWTALWRR